jgi:hypothetical protein
VSVGKKKKEGMRNVQRVYNQVNWAIANNFRVEQCHRSIQMSDNEDTLHQAWWPIWNHLVSTANQNEQGEINHLSGSR